MKIVFILLMIFPMSWAALAQSDAELARALFDFKRYNFELKDEHFMTLEDVFEIGSKNHPRQLLFIDHDFLRHTFSKPEGEVVIRKTHSRAKKKVRWKKIVKNLLMKSAKKTATSMAGSNKTIMLEFGIGPSINWRQLYKQAKDELSDKLAGRPNIDDQLAHFKSLLLLSLQQLQTESSRELLGTLMQVEMDHEFYITSLTFEQGEFARSESGNSLRSQESDVVIQLP